MKRAEVIEEVSRCCELTRKEAREIVEQILSSISQALSRREVVIIRRFGSFHVHDRKARMVRNPNSGAMIAVPPKSVVRFTAAKSLTDDSAFSDTNQPCSAPQSVLK